MGYVIEQKPCSKDGWFTPDEARRYYGKYARDGVTVHWWGDGTGADNHDNIVNYLNGKGARGEAPTANYVLSDNKITQCVDPDNVAWTSSNGNATTIGIETQPTLGDEGYKKWGWLLDQLEKRYGKTLKLYPHNYWQTTQCPGTLSLDRIRQEADKWKRGEYDPTPVPVPPSNAQLEWVKLPTPIVYETLKNPTNLWNFNQTSWAGFGAPVKQLPLGELVTIYGKVINRTLGATYLVTEYSFTRGISNGFNVVDMKVHENAPIPVPPVEPPKPDWVTNLRNIDDTKFWLKNDANLMDITTGKPTGTKSFKKDEEFIASALTVAGGKEYRITEYSYSKGVFNGVLTSDLTLTPPGVPNIPPVPEQPTEPDRNAVIAFLVMLAGKLGEALKLVTDFLGKFRR